MKLLYTLFLLFFGVTAQAADLPYAGIWKGSIGDDKVMMCFDSDSYAQYYYLRNLRGIILNPEDRAARTITTHWKEVNGLNGDDGKKRSSWTVAGLGSAGNTLDVAWTSPDGKKSIPVKLTKVPAMDGAGVTYYDTCGAEFYKPLEDGLRHTSKDMKFEGREYRSIITPAAITFELPASVPGSKNFNDYSRIWLRKAAGEFYDCIRNIGDNDTSYWGRGFEPLLWTDSKLVVKDWLSGVVCEGMHTYAYEEYESFDLHTGKVIDTWLWLKHGAKSVDGENGQKTRLREMLEERLNVEMCRRSDDTFHVDNPYAGKYGMVFRMSFLYRTGSCQDNVNIPYKQIMPFLTPAGKAAVAEFLQP